MKGNILEVCIDNLESAIAAQAGGADRLELCGSLVIGGITPDPTLFAQVKKHTDIPVRCMIRPRFGDFLYTKSEFKQMKESIKLYKELGADGVVFGILLPDGSLDIPRMAELIEISEGMELALHRAFDMTANKPLALEQAAELGFDTVLTSGGHNSVWEGRQMLSDLVLLNKDIEILAGGGVTPGLIEPLWKETGVTSYHLSGRKIVDSKMLYRNPQVNMGLPTLSEYEIWQTDALIIAEAKDAMENILNK